MGIRGVGGDLTLARAWLAALALAAGCGGGSKPADATSSAVSLSLDANGAVSASVTTPGPGGATLTVPTGTRVVPMASGAPAAAPAASAKVELALVAGPSGAVALPSGVQAIASLRISLTIDGVEREASFWPAPDAPGVSATPAGLELTVPVDAQSLGRGATGLLYAVRDGVVVLVGTSAVQDAASGAATPRSLTRRAATAGGGAEMEFSATSTGTYAAGAAPAGTDAASPPAGAFSSTFTIPDPGCVTVGAASVCGPFRVERAGIIEPSTGEVLGTCWFGASDVAVTAPVPSGYRFYCSRSAGAASELLVQVSSMQANLPSLDAWLVRASDGLPALETSVSPTGGLTGPGGSYNDPYAHPELQFAGAKRLTFTTKVDRDWAWMKQNVQQPLLTAGYQAVVSSFVAVPSPGFTAEVWVYDTLDGRARIETDVVVKQDGWKPSADPGAAQGNLGKYEYTQGGYTGTIDAVITQDTQYFKRNDVIHATVTLTLDKATTYRDNAAATQTTVTGDLWTLLASGTPVNWSVCNASTNAPGKATLMIHPTLDGYGIIWAGPSTGQQTCEVSIVDSRGTVLTSTKTQQLIISEVMLCDAAITDPTHLTGTCSETSSDGVTTTLTWDLRRQ